MDIIKALTTSYGFYDGVSVLPLVMADNINAAGQSANGENRKEKKGSVEIVEAPSVAEGFLAEKVAIDTVEAEQEYTPAEYRRLLWKIDLWLLPLMWFCYGTQQADKARTISSEVTVNLADFFDN